MMAARHLVPAIPFQPGTPVMRGRGSPFDGILRDEGFRPRMSARLAPDRVRSGYRLRPQRHVRVRGAVPDHGPLARPVIVKVVLADRGKGAGRRRIGTLLDYIAKDGPLFDRTRAGIDPKVVAAAWGEDRRIFHVILSPEHGARLDMADYARAVVASWERRLGPLEWVASVEEKPDRAHAGGNRHLHIALRGVQGRCDLVLDRDVVSGWLRADAVAVATERLGPMDLEERRRLDLRAERLREERAVERALERGGGRER